MWLESRRHDCPGKQPCSARAGLDRFKGNQLRWAAFCPIPATAPPPQPFLVRACYVRGGERASPGFDAQAGTAAPRMVLSVHDEGPESALAVWKAPQDEKKPALGEGVSPAARGVSFRARAVA